MSASKITPEQAVAIRETYLNKGHGGAGTTSLAQRYGVSAALIHRVLTGEHPAAKGLPDIGGQRGGMRLARTWNDGDTNLRVKSLGTRQTALPAKAERRKSACPEPGCGAWAHEPCWSRNRTYPVPMKELHAGRGLPAAGVPEQTENVVPESKDEGHG